MEENRQMQPGAFLEIGTPGAPASSETSGREVVLAERVQTPKSTGRPSLVVRIGLVLIGLLFLITVPPAAIGLAVLLAVAAGMAVVGAGLYWIARWILGPLDRAARQVEAPVQFTLADFLCLFVLVQIPMALIHGVLADREHGIRWMLDIYAWFAFGAVWLASAQRLSRAGIHRQWPRALFLTLVVPSAVFGVVVALPLAVALIALAAGFVPQEFVDLNRPYVPFAIVAEIALVAAVYASGLVTRRIVARAQAEGESPRVA